MRLKSMKKASKRSRNYSLFFNMGVCLMEEKRYMEAAAAFRNALPGSWRTEVYYYLGAVLTEMRHFNDAIDYIQFGSENQSRLTGNCSITWLRYTPCWTYDIGLRI